MPASTIEKTPSRSLKSLKLYMAVHTGIAIKRIVGKNTTLPILAGSLKGKKWIVGAGISQILGTWQEKYTNQFEKSVYQSSVVYDVGAQVGWYTLLASDLVGQTGKVIAFEPLPSVLQYLKKHVQANHCTNVQIVEAAVSDRDGTATFFAKTDGSLGALSPIYGPNTTTVKTAKIDSLVKNEIIPVPSLIKMDIEGGELAALKGAEATLVEHAPIIFLETHGDEMYVNCCNLLTSFGYELEHFRESGAVVARNWQVSRHNSPRKRLEKRTAP